MDTTITLTSVGLSATRYFLRLKRGNEEVKREVKASLLDNGKLAVVIRPIEPKLIMVPVGESMVSQLSATSIVLLLGGLSGGVGSKARELKRKFPDVFG